MEITDEIRQAHASLSEVSLRFLEFVCRNQECQDRSNFSLLGRHHDLIEHRLQSWPIFVGQSFHQELARSSVVVTGLIKSVPERFFNADPRKLSQFYALDERYTSVLTELLKMRHHSDGMVSRNDFVYGPSGLKCLECNMSSNLGGWEVGVYASWYSQVPVLKPFFGELSTDLVYIDVPFNFFQHIVQRAQKRPANEKTIHIAFIVPEKSNVTLRGFEKFCRNKLQEAAGDSNHPIQAYVSVCENSDFREHRGKLYLGDRRVDVVLERTYGLISREVFRNLLIGNVDVYNGPLTALYADKRNLALLSDSVGTDRLTQEESNLVAKLIPWTRELEPGTTLYGDERVDLLNLVEAQRQRMVLKPARSSSGEGVCLGRHVNADDWTTAVQEALASERPWVVQEHVESYPFLCQSGQFGASPHDVIWGPFVFGDRYAGTFLRMLPKEISGVVNRIQGAVDGTIIKVCA